MENIGKILIVDDNEDVLLSLNMLLKSRVEAVRVIKDPTRIDEFMETFNPDVILLDMNFTRDASSGEEGYKWLEHILQLDPQAVVLFITAYFDYEKAVRAIKAGAVDFIPKPWNKDKLLAIVESALELRFSRKETPKLPNTPTFIGECEAMQRLREDIEKVAPTDANILITGENGTGKDVVAHLVHSFSRRSEKAFETIDLGSLPESLFEAELFGYEKGAFTDAKTSKAGRIETADGGTLFLDEIGNLSLEMQQKLLTVIEKREISRLGSTRRKNVDVRLVCATNADLKSRANDGSFRQDLLFRINTIVLNLPPLRQRGNDIILLAESFARKMAEKYGKSMPTFAEDARKKLLEYSWPGNVRELQHTIERAVILTPAIALNGKSVVKIEAKHLEIEITPRTTSPREEDRVGVTYNLAEVEQQTIMRALAVCDGNLSQAAEMLGITRYALYRKISKLN